MLRRIELRSKAVGNPGTVERIGQLAGNAGCRRHGRINVSKELMVDGHRCAGISDEARTATCVTS